jgi:hypothetical protein
MRTITFFLVAVALLTGSWAFAQAAPTTGAPATGQPGVVPGAPTVGGPAATNKPAAKRGDFYYKVTPDTEALWKQLGQLQDDQHQKDWELYTLLSATPVDSQAVPAKLKELADNRKQIKHINTQLEPSKVIVDMRQYTKGAGHHHKGQQPAAATAAPATPAATTPPATTPAAPAGTPPAPAN